MDGSGKIQLQDDGTVDMSASLMKIVEVLQMLEQAGAPSLKPSGRMNSRVGQIHR